MEQELITIYDENLTEIGTKSRKEVHEKGYWLELPPVTHYVR